MFSMLSAKTLLPCRETIYITNMFLSRSQAAKCERKKPTASPRLGAFHEEREILGVVAEHFGADTAVGVDFQQERVAEAAVDDVDFANAFVECFQAAFDFGDHARLDRAFAN